jgi:hypothetical protein
MRVAMAVRLSATMAVHAIGRQIDHVAVAHAALGDDVVGEFLHFGAAALEHGDFHAALVVEMHVQRRVGEIVPGVKVAGEPLGQLALLMIVDVDQRGDAWPRAADLGRGLLQAGAGKVADRLGAVGIAAPGHEAVQLASESVVDGDGHALHCGLPGWTTQ